MTPRQMTETAYMAASTGLLWVAIYYLPIGDALFRLAIPLPLVLLQLRHGGRTAFEGVAVTVLLLTVLMGPVRGPLMLFPYGLLSLWLGWCWRRQCSWWFSMAVGVLIGAAGFLVRVALVSLLLGENLWVVITGAASGLLNGLADRLQLPVAPTLDQVQVAALLLVVAQNIVYLLALHAVAWWVLPRLRQAIPDPPRLLRPLLALDPS
ncbi:MAG: DUF2232 domain-containing protein [Prochlorococcaceae cyanobacterium]